MDNDDFLDDIPDLSEDDVTADAVPFIRGSKMSVQEYAAWLKRLREEKGFTLAALSELTGYSAPYLSQIETGKKKKYPLPGVIEQLSKVFAVQYSDMLRLAGYDDLAQGIRMREVEEIFGSQDFATDTINILNMRIADLQDKLKWLERLTDLTALLENKIPPLVTYNGHTLTPEERQLASRVLAALFPEY